MSPTSTGPFPTAASYRRYETQEPVSPPDSVLRWRICAFRRRRFSRKASVSRCFCACFSGDSAGLAVFGAGGFSGFIGPAFGSGGSRRERRREQASGFISSSKSLLPETEACHDPFAVAETARPVEPACRRPRAILANHRLVRTVRDFSGTGLSCGSSVVEHSIGNGEVESSILSRSTIYAIVIPKRPRYAVVYAH